MNQIFTRAILIYLTLNLSLYASNNVKSTTDIVKAQIETSKAAIDSVTRSVYKESDLSDFNLSDYKNQVVEFKNNLEIALVEFDNTMEFLILARVKELVDHYNAIYNSDHFSPSQKKIILIKQYQEISNEMEEISGRYQDAIKTLLSSTGDLLFDYEFKIYDLMGEKLSKSEKIVRKWAQKNGRARDQHFRHHLIQYPHFLVSGVQYEISTVRDKYAYQLYTLLNYASGWDSNDFARGIRYYKSLVPKRSKRYLQYPYYLKDPNDQRIEIDPITQRIRDKKSQLVKEDLDQFYPQQFEIIRGSCQSQLCVSLRGADILLFFKEVREKLDLEIDFQLADGKYIILENYKFSEYLVKYFVEKTEFPVDLPFDVD
ncbi:MAG: hypothetical protein VX642_07710 [Bdellovibrionota bacterium]|nr:hypothetical protein [Bdellovibrionota bacterium]